MRSMNVKILMVVLVAIVAASCAASEEYGGSGASGDPAVTGVCAPDHPDCVDKVVAPGAETGGLTPTAPDGSDGISPSSGFVVGNGLTITEALAYEGAEVIAVGGFVVTTSEGTLLCEALAESFPPQCGGPSLTVLNPDGLSGFILLEEGGTQWSPDVVVVFGHVSGTDLTISTNVTG